MAKTHKTEEVPKAEDSRTRALVQPFAAFKRPKKTSGADSDITISSVRFILPNNQAVDVPAGSYILMGRQQGNDRHIDFDLSVLYGPESGVSRTHAVMQITETDVFIRDLDSTNGTYLNGAELYAMRDYPVNDGDQLKLGSVTMRIIFVSE
jgi:pSer/pThr/pTyr-binding forkhead associated (FHA) protein